MDITAEVLHFVFYLITKPRKSTKPIHKIRLTKVSAAAWFLIIAFGIIPCSYLFLTNSTQQAPVPPLVSDSVIDSSELPDSYAFILNEAEKGNSENKICIPGHFWEELKEEELTAILLGISNSYPLSGTVNYRGDGTIFNLNIYADYLKNNTDSKIYIQISPDKIVLDEIFITEPVPSEIMGIAVTAGYYKNQENTTYFASFTRRIKSQIACWLMNTLRTANCSGQSYYLCILCCHCYHIIRKSKEMIIMEKTSNLKIF